MFMDIMDFDVDFGTLTYESGPGCFDDFPYTNDPVHILGESYSAKYDRDELKNDIKSRIWITYRRNFPCIGGAGGPMSDTGWGCMLRCGQMMLAQVLLMRHIGRKWRWNDPHTDETYWKILKMFEDKTASIYSIHQIASMGQAEGKDVGHWFGPNTIAQVLKRIAVYDKWSGIEIHVALNNVVITDEICKKCKSQEVTFSKFVNDGNDDAPPRHNWKPLFLVIPLRVGLDKINDIYFNSIKKCLMLNQSVGFLGGQPNHAQWFIGYFGQELIYLDPHTTQRVVDLEQRGASDQTYHCCSPPSRMSFHKLDPSIALGFYCHTERDFDDLCKTFTLKDPSCEPVFEVWPDSNGPEGTKTFSGAKIDFAASESLSENGSGDEDEFVVI